MKRSGAKPGDLVAVPLPGGGHCVGRMYRDATIGVYFDVTKERINDTSFDAPPDLVAGVFTTRFKEEGWEVFGNVPFDSIDDAWAPPTFKRDITNPATVHIYERGVLRKASEEDIRGMDRAAVHPPGMLALIIAERIRARASSPGEEGGTGRP